MQCIYILTACMYMLPKFSMHTDLKHIPFVSCQLCMVPLYR
jgi:hypothetical protein